MMMNPNTNAPQPLDRGTKYGMGFFETIKVVNGKPQFLKQHIDRLMRGVRVAGIKAPGIYSHILDEIASLPIQGNNTISLTVSDVPSGYKLTVTAEVRMHNPYAERGLRVGLVDAIRDKYNPLTRMKSCNYLLNLLVHQRANESGWDEVLFLNQEGNVTEGTFTNFFFIKGEEVITAPPSEGLLPGVFRGALIDALETAGVPVIERPISYHREIETMDGAFVTNSLIPIERVSSIGNKDFGETETYMRVLRVAETLF